MDQSVTFYTISSETQGFYKEKGSKFFAHAFPVNSEAQIRERLDQLRKMYHDARHHCYAYKLGLHQPIIRANDDGEPNHSAGDPILGQIRAFDLTDTLVVVVRYFGGTKLGVGGLVHAYKTAAEDALIKIQKIEVFEKLQFEIVYSYEQTPTVERLIQQFELHDLDRKFEAQCVLEACVRKHHKELVDQFTTDQMLSIHWKDQV